MNEAETRAELIDPKLKESGWGVMDGSKILREYNITAGKIQTGGGCAKPLIANYVLMYHDRKLAVIEVESDSRGAFPIFCKNAIKKGRVKYHKQDACGTMYN